MANHTGRLYVLALALVIFFVGWAAIAARPWAQRSDPRLQRLAVRAAQLKQEAKLVNQIVALRAQKSRQQPASVTASAPAVKVVNLPPLTVTRTS